MFKCLQVQYINFVFNPLRVKKVFKIIIYGIFVRDNGKV